MPNKVRPITPDEVARTKKTTFPPAVFEAFNELIAQKFSGGSATIQQEELVKLMVDKGLDRSEIFERGWLNIEEVYREVGWEVEYDKPGYNESSSAMFNFRKKRV